MDRLSDQETDSTKSESCNINKFMGNFSVRKRLDKEEN